MDQPVVLVVSNTSAQRDALTHNLLAEGLGVRLAHSAAEGMALAATEPPDMILLDSTLPDMSGSDLCRRLKTRPETRPIPIILLSARFEEVDRLRRSKTGADDYLIKPCSIFELLARVRMQLRRIRPDTAGQTLEFDGIVLDFESHLVYKAGKTISLSPTCLRLLATFLERPGRVWGREDLIKRAWGHDIRVDIRTVDVHIGRLRKAFTSEGVKDPLRTVRGVGYVLV